jgi:hypothetical protein
MSQPSLYVIVDGSNSRIADAHEIRGARRFINWQGMEGRWFVKLRADWKGK